MGPVRAAGAELAHVLAAAAAVERGGQRVHGRAAHEILLPGDLVGRVRLRFRAGAEAHARDAVAALDGHAVGGERPFVDQRAAALVHRRGMALPLAAVERAVRLGHGLHVRRALLVDPGGEVALRLVHKARPGGAVVAVHGDLGAVLFARGQRLDLLQARIPRLARGHAPVDGDRA